MQRPIRTLSALSTAALLLVTTASASHGAEPPADAVGYWTAERAQGAAPRDVVLDVGNRPVSPRPKPDNPGNGKGKGGGGTDPEPGGDSTGSPWPDSDDPVDDIVGKVLFTLGTTDYVCSASTVAPHDDGGGWVVLTAGHCTWDVQVGYATNWVFVPDYEDVLAFGCDQGLDTCFPATGLFAATDWIESGAKDYGSDVAFVAMAAAAEPSGLAPSALPVVEMGDAVGRVVTAFGYPAAKRYDGSDLIHCSGTTAAGPPPYDANPQLACDMTGGSSGGPWYVDDGAGVRSVVSLNSFGLRGYNGYMFGPQFDSNDLEALAEASAAVG